MLNHVIKRGWRRFHVFCNPDIDSMLITAALYTQATLYCVDHMWHVSYRLLAWVPVDIPGWYLTLEVMHIFWISQPLLSWNYCRKLKIYWHFLIISQYWYGTVSHFYTEDKNMFTLHCQCHGRWWPSDVKRVVMMSTLSSQVAWDIVMTTSNSSSDDKAVTISLDFQYSFVDAMFYALLYFITWFAVHCFSSVHCTQCIVQYNAL